MGNLISKYFIKEQKKDIFHSSEYGKAQSGEMMGAMSIKSFNERMKVEQNRQVIKGYNDSRVAEQRFNGGVRAKKYIPPEKKESLGVKKIESGRRPNMSSELPKTNSGFNPPAYKNRFGK